jgi:hypothetical protein
MALPVRILERAHHTLPGHTTILNDPKLELASSSPPLAPPPRIDGAIMRSLKPKKGTFSRELNRGHF